MAQGALPEFKEKARLCKAAHFLACRNMLPAGSGSLSIRTGMKTLWLTPPGAAPALVAEDRLIQAMMDGRCLGGVRLPEETLQLHIRCYQLHPEARAVLQLTPPYVDRLEQEFPPFPGHWQAGSGGLPSHWGYCVGQSVLLFGQSLDEALSSADQMDWQMHKRLLEGPFPRGAGDAEPGHTGLEKAAVMEQVIDAVTRRLRKG